MSYNNNGFTTPADYAALLSGLRGAQSQAGNGSRSISPMSMQQQQQMLMQQQQLYNMQQQQQRQGHYNVHSQQQFMPQPQHQQQHSAQAQMFASQIELQLQQIKMANLALQEQLIIQQQKQHQQQQQQQQQQARSQSPAYNNFAALGVQAGYGSMQQQQQSKRSVSVGAVSSYVNASAPLPLEDASNWQQNNGSMYGNNTEAGVQIDLSAEARHEARRGALQNLQQARQQRSHSPAASISSTTISPPPANLDWQAQRMQYRSASAFVPGQAAYISQRSTPPPETVVTPPAQIDSSKRDLHISHNNSSLQQHRKNSSDVSDASIQSLSISEANSHFSPNRGPALVLSKPGDEFPEDEGDDSVDDGPMSPSLTASMRAVSINSALTAVDEHTSKQNERRRSSSSGRHTVILSSSIVDLRAAAASGSGGRNSPFSSGSESSSNASSPTSDKSEVASFESTISTNATSLPNDSPTSTSFETDSNKQSSKEAHAGLGIRQSSETVPSTLPARRAVSAALPASLNPSASVFAPGPSPTTSKTYPSSLSAGSGSTTTGTYTPNRIFTAPARNGTPTGNQVTITRQPKGPADEKDLQARNFAGMIRRKAIGALRLAAASGAARASPVSSPVLAGFPGKMAHHPDSGPLQRLSSPPNAVVTSPLAHQTSFNMSDLATRAMKRRSMQGGFSA
jgi:hypothetical protein